MDSSLDIKINFGSLLKFALPTILSMVIMSVFGSIDGIFISRFIDVASLSAANISMPILTATIAVGAMFAAGGSALVAKKKGEGLEVEARENFSLLIYFIVGISVLAAIIVLIFMEPLLRQLGADDFLMGMTREYITPIVIAIPFISLGFIFNQFLIADGKPTLAMIITIIGGLSNISLNWVFIYLMDMELFGAALATTIGYSVPSVVGIVYFTFFRKGSGLYFVKPRLDLKAITQSMTNGLSEFISMFALTVTTTFMNNIIMDIEGPLGVAAVGIMMAVQGLMTSLFMGYAFGVSPLISFNHGKGDTDNLKKIYALSLKTVFALSLISILVGNVFASPLTAIYVPRGAEVYEMAVYGLRVVTTGFVFIAFNIFASAMFTALNNGKISGLLSFFRSLVFLSFSFLVMPRFFQMNGVWIAIPLAELLALAMTVYYFKKMKPKYHYA
ncbi:MAG: MATE family efflux transporter [Turicibacter sp.]|nr:MATE family efflux transporter [Turicibacter sp.]